MSSRFVLRLVLALSLCCSFAALADGEVSMPNLLYKGGHIISNVQVVPVLWGPDVYAETQQRIGDFYKTLVVSSYFDSINEYDTTRSNGTMQTFGMGTSDKVYTITPINQNGTLGENDLAGEIAAQVMAGVLPPPNNNTLYMLHFAPNFTLTNSGGSDCSQPNGQFCAYHSNGHIGAQIFRFGAMPDMSQGGCTMGCASNPNLTPFEVLTDNASHEFDEAITDPDNATGWYDGQPTDPVTMHAENGDICANLFDDSATIPDGDGGVYYVQREWSNQYKACIVSKNDVFTVDFDVPKPTVTPGGTVVVTATLGLPTNNITQTISTHIFGVPTGVAINPSPFPRTLHPGQSTQISIQVDAAAPVGTYNLEVLFFGPRATIFKALPVKVQKEGLTLSFDPTDLTVNSGATVTSAITTINAGSAKMVTLSATGLPDGVVATFDPAVVNAGDTSTMTLTVDKAAAGVTMQGFSVVGTAGTLTASSDGTLTVNHVGCSTSAGGLSWLAALAVLLIVRRRS